jgi:flagellar biosynthetic protein FlhB
MAEGAEGEDRTEAATPRRLARAREEGQVPVSAEAGSFLALLLGTGVLLLVVPVLAPRLAAGLAGVLARATGPFDPAAALAETARLALLAAGPFALAAILAGAVAALGQSGFLISAAALKPNASRLNPLTGLKRLLGAEGLIETVKSTVKLLAILAVVAAIGRGLAPGVLTQFPAAPARIGAGLLGLLAALLAGVLAVQAVVAAADLALVRWRFLRRLRMNRQELREEQKETEGDPHIKARIKQLRMARARRRMLAQVAKATVVITNPTHYAVALAYDRARHAAPRVLAKGVDSMAARIREAARKHNVPLVANPPLARALHALPLEAEIPPEHFRAVAEIIAYVWRLSERVANRGGGAAR